MIPHLKGIVTIRAQFIVATANPPCADFVWPRAGGPPQVHEQWEQERAISRRPEAIYKRAFDKPGSGWDQEAG